MRTNIRLAAALLASAYRAGEFARESAIAEHIAFRCENPSWRHEVGMRRCDVELVLTWPLVLDGRSLAHKAV